MGLVQVIGMADRQLMEFYKRAARYERGYARGRGFEALGTLGRSAYRPRRKMSVPILAPILMMLAVCLLMKAAMLLQLGPDLYAERVEKLRAGSLTERAGAVLLQPDPVSGRIAEMITRMF